jgi:hypothetical protein
MSEREKDLKAEIAAKRAELAGIAFVKLVRKYAPLIGHDTFLEVLGILKDAGRARGWIKKQEPERAEPSPPPRRVPTPDVATPPELD